MKTDSPRAKGLVVVNARPDIGIYAVDAYVDDSRVLCRTDMSRREYIAAVFFVICCSGPDVRVRFEDTGKEHCFSSGFLETVRRGQFHKYVVNPDAVGVGGSYGSHHW